MEHDHPKFAAVILDKGVDRPLDYLTSVPVKVGMRVLVPLRQSFRKGTVVALKREPSVSRVQTIKEVLSEEPIISSELFELAKWMSHYYCTPLSRVLRAFLPDSVKKGTRVKEQFFVKRLLSQKKLSTLCSQLRYTHPSQAKVLSALLKHPKGILLSRLLELVHTSKSPIDTLAKQKILNVEKVPVDRSMLDDFEFFLTKPKKLNEEQKMALSRIRFNLFQTHLIHGVTGSGKTEIYLQAIRLARERGLGVIFLVPEIALTTQTIERLRSRFTEKLGIFHHRLSDGERFDIWHGIRKGEISIVIGARSAIFSPVQNLGLIIVDEEQESSYKQAEKQPCYHARDIAVMRGKMSCAAVVLGSATPSLESYLNALSGKYLLTHLSKRATHAPLPHVRVVDMKREYLKSKGFTIFSDLLIERIKRRFSLGEQTLLFLNRRGYHTFQMCVDCGKSIKCPHCSVSLTFHKRANHLICHLCAHTIAPAPHTCPSCKKAATLSYRGVGTEQVERVLHAILPEIRTLRMDGDTTSHKGSHDLLFQQFRAGKADVLIGTQMIAKGLHFPAVTLVGIINSDGALNLPDFRASETLFQLLGQVSGRSGRSDLPGEVIIQTCLGDHNIFKHTSHGDYRAFFDEEIQVRELFNFPPFTRLAKLIFKGRDERETLNVARAFQKELLRALPETFHIYPVVPSGYAKIKDHFRFKLLVKGNNPLLLSQLIKRVQSILPIHRDVCLLIDIDPLSTFS